MEKVSYFLKLGEKYIDILKKEKLINKNFIKQKPQDYLRIGGSSRDDDDDYERNSRTHHTRGRHTHDDPTKQKQ